MGDPSKKAWLLEKQGIGDDTNSASTLSGKADGTRFQGAIPGISALPPSGFVYFHLWPWLSWEWHRANCRPLTQQVQMAPVSPIPSTSGSSWYELDSSVNNVEEPKLALENKAQELVVVGDETKTRS